MKSILVRPLVTEKMTELGEKPMLKQFAFVVERDANKIEIKQAIEQRYQVQVRSLRTAVMPSKPKYRMTRSRFLKGRTPVYKKAIVTLMAGQSIDFYQEI